MFDHSRPGNVAFGPIFVGPRQDDTAECPHIISPSIGRRGEFMRFKGVFFLASGFALGGLSWTSAEASPVFLNMFTESSSTASLQLGNSTSSNTVVAQNASSVFTPTLSASGSYSAALAGLPDVASAESTATLTLSSASSGVAELTSGAALDLTTAGVVGAAHTGGNTGETPNYIAYAFTDARPFTASFTYDDYQSGSETGYFGPYTSLQGGGLLGAGTYATNGTGSFSQTFTPGFYQFEFYDDIYSADALEGAAPSDVNSITDYKLSFTISDVPEPTSWTLMLIGLGFLGARLRETRGLGRFRSSPSWQRSG
jgi:hypothetical protein